MDGYTFRTELAKICPDYDIQEDNEGGLVIYTGLIDIGNDTYEPRPNNYEGESNE